MWRPGNNLRCCLLLFWDRVAHGPVTPRPGVLGIHPPLLLQYWDYKSAQPHLAFYDAFSCDHAAHVWGPESDIMSDTTPRSHLKMIPFPESHLEVVISLNFLILPSYFEQELQGHNDRSQAVIAKPEHLAVWIARASCTQEHFLITLMFFMRWSICCHCCGRSPSGWSRQPDDALASVETAAGLLGQLWGDVAEHLNIWIELKPLWLRFKWSSWWLPVSGQWLRGPTPWG